MPSSRVHPDLIAPLLALYLDTEQVLLEKCGKFLVPGADQPGWAEKKRAQVAFMVAEFRSMLFALTGQVPTLVETALLLAYLRGVEAADEDLDVAVRLGRGKVHPKVVGVPAEAAVRALLSEQILTVSTTLTSTHLRAITTTNRVLGDVIAEAAAHQVTGVLTRREAAQRALDGFAKKGITGFVDKRGRGFDMATYVESTMRQAVARSAVNGHHERLLERGYDLVIVSNSPEECPDCRKWEGKVLSLTGKTQGYPTLKQAEAAGLFHPGCTHSTSLYIPGITKVPTTTANPQGYKDRQEQRRLERRVRDARRLEAAAITQQAMTDAARMIRLRQAAAKAHAEKTGQPRQPHREQINTAR